MKIICNMIESLDGRLLPTRWSPTERPLDVSELYESTAKRLGGRGFIIGRTTMAEYGNGVTEGGPAEKRSGGTPPPEPFMGGWKGGDVGVVFDSKARLSFTTNRLPNGESVVVVLPRDVGDDHLSKLRAAGVCYVFEGEGADDRSRIAGALREIEMRFGVTTLLLEGGGIINGAFLKAGLIDEISMIVFPALDALYGAPSVFGYLGGKDERPAENVRLTLLRNETLEGGAVWLHYRVRNL